MICMTKTIIDTIKSVKWVGVLLLFIVSSCTLDTMSDNGDFTGFWHLERIDTISTGGTCDVSDVTMFWCVENNLLQLRGGAANYLLRFNRSGGILTLYDPYLFLGHQEGDEGGDVKLTDPSGLRQYGIQHLEEQFAEEKLKGSKMVLATDSFRLHLKKF